MFKVCLLISLAIVGGYCQVAAPVGGDQASGVAEPYSYGYETDTHSAAEQRDPNGQVTGYYTLTDADGRQRRVEYVADEAGFRAKVQTNELGTKSANSADVEVLASPPTEGQLVYQAPAPQVQVQRQQTVSVQQPARVQQQTATYFQQQQQPYGYGYYPGGAYGSSYGYAAGYPAGYGGYTGGYSTLAPSSAYNQGYYTSYNNHLPSQYYQALGQQQQGAAGYTGGARYITTGAVLPQQQQRQQRVGNWQTIGGYQTVGVVPSSQAGYSSSVSTTRSSGLQGSSNYIVLKKKRDDSAAVEVEKKN